MSEPLSDADKLRVLAAWFDMWDAANVEKRQRLLVEDGSPARNDVQRDLRRIAARVEAEAAEPPALDVERLARAMEAEGIPVELGTRYPFSPGDARRAAYRDLAKRLAVRLTPASEEAPE